MNFFKETRCEFNLIEQIFRMKWNFIGDKRKWKGISKTFGIFPVLPSYAYKSEVSYLALLL